MDLTAIFGAGNILRRDDGIGVYIAREIEKRKPDCFEVFEIGTEIPFMDIEKYYKNIIFIDGIKGAGKPGEVFVLKNFEFSDFFSFSSHEKNYLSEIFIMKQIYFKETDIYLFGVEIFDDGWGIGLSPLLLNKFDDILLKLEKLCYIISKKEIENDILGTEKI